MHNEVGTCAEILPFPLRPIVSSIGSALYNTSKFLLDILSPIQNLNGYSVLNSSQFANEVANMEISDDEVMVSFDVVSLFTAIPVNKACAYIRDKLNNDNTLHLRTSLNTDDIISLLEFILSNNCFVYYNCIYKQIHGCAMGSPVSPIVANPCMEVIEELALSTSSVPPKVWKRYVDDSFVIIMQRAQTLLTMHGKTTTPLTLKTLVLLTKAITAFKKH